MDWSVAGPLIGVIVGGLLTATTEAIRARGTFRREKAWQLLEDRRRRLEQIYEAAESHRVTYDVAAVKLVAAATGIEIPRDTFAPVAQFPLARLRMLVHLYEPALINALMELERGANDYGTATSRVVGAVRGSRGTVVKEVFLPVLEALNGAHNQFLSKLVSVSAEVGQAVHDLAPNRGLRWWSRR